MLRLLDTIVILGVLSCMSDMLQKKEHTSAITVSISIRFCVINEGLLQQVVTLQKAGSFNCRGIFNEANHNFRLQ